MNKAERLSDSEFDELDNWLSKIVDGKIPNTEALDGFFAALACGPSFVKPSEYLPVIQNSDNEDGALAFDTIEEAQRFFGLVTKHWNFINYQLSSDEVYLPWLLENEGGEIRCNDWANGFLSGINMRHDDWAELINSEEHSGSMVPIWALAYEHHPDASMRPFKEPVDEEKREELLIAAAAGVMRMHKYFRDDANFYSPASATYKRPHPKVGRNEPCPCGSGKKYKRCCGGVTLH